MNITECEGNHTITENPYLCVREFLIGTPNMVTENNDDCGSWSTTAIVIIVFSITAGAVILFFMCFLLCYGMFTPAKQKTNAELQMPLINTDTDGPQADTNNFLRFAKMIRYLRGQAEGGERCQRNECVKSRQDVRKLEKENRNLKKENKQLHDGIMDCHKLVLLKNGAKANLECNRKYILCSKDMKPGTEQSCQFTTALTGYHISCDVGSFLNSGNKRKTKEGIVAPDKPTKFYVTKEELAKVKEEQIIFYCIFDANGESVYKLPLVDMDSIVTAVPQEEIYHGLEVYKWSVLLTEEETSIKFKIILGDESKRKESPSGCPYIGNAFVNSGAYTKYLKKQDPVSFFLTRKTIAALQFSGPINGAAISYKLEL